MEYSANKFGFLGEEHVVNVRVRYNCRCFRQNSLCAEVAKISIGQSGIACEDRIHIVEDNNATVIKLECCGVFDRVTKDQHVAIQINVAFCGNNERFGCIQLGIKRDIEELGLCGESGCKLSAEILGIEKHVANDFATASDRECESVFYIINISNCICGLTCHCVGYNSACKVALVACDINVDTILVVRRSKLLGGGDLKERADEIILGISATVGYGEDLGCSTVAKEGYDLAVQLNNVLSESGACGLRAVYGKKRFLGIRLGYTGDRISIKVRVLCKVDTCEGAILHRDGEGLICRGSACRGVRSSYKGENRSYVFSINNNVFESEDRISLPGMRTKNSSGIAGHEDLCILDGNIVATGERGVVTGNIISTAVDLHVCTRSLEGMEECSLTRVGDVCALNHEVCAGALTDRDQGECGVVQDLRACKRGLDREGVGGSNLECEHAVAVLIIGGNGVGVRGVDTCRILGNLKRMAVEVEGYVTHREALVLGSGIRLAERAKANRLGKNDIGIKLDICAAIDLIEGFIEYLTDLSRGEIAEKEMAGDRSKRPLHCKRCCRIIGYFNVSNRSDHSVGYNVLRSIGSTAAIGGRSVCILYNIV